MPLESLKEERKNIKDITLERENLSDIQKIENYIRANEVEIIEKIFYESKLRETSFAFYSLLIVDPKILEKFDQQFKNAIDNNAKYYVHECETENALRYHQINKLFHSEKYRQIDENFGSYWSWINLVNSIIEKKPLRKENQQQWFVFAMRYSGYKTLYPKINLCEYSGADVTDPMNTNEHWNLNLEDREWKGMISILKTFEKKHNFKEPNDCIEYFELLYFIRVLFPERYNEELKNNINSKALETVKNYLLNKKEREIRWSFYLQQHFLYKMMIADDIRFTEQGVSPIFDESNLPTTPPPPESKNL